VQKVHGAEQMAAERDKENNVVSDITVGNVCETAEKKSKTSRQNKTRYKTEFNRN